MKGTNLQPVYCPRAVVETLPKAALADAAFNFAMQLSEDDPDRAIALLVQEAESCQRQQRNMRTAVKGEK